MDEEQLRGQIRDLTALLEVSKHLGSTTELVPLLRRVETATLEVLNCERATVFLYDAASDVLYSKVATAESEIRFSAKLGVAGDTVRSRSIENVPEAYADPRFNPEIDKKTGYRTRSILAIPLTGYSGEIVGVLQSLNKRGGVFDRRDEEAGMILGSLAGVAIQRQMLLDEFADKQRLLHDLAVAREIQKSLLPKGDPTVEGYDIAGWNQPADETGGDCYDYVSLPGGGIGLLVADATGHGIGPALIVSECRALIRALSMATDDLSMIMLRVNELLLQDLAGGRFVTAFFGVLDPHVHAIEYVSAGHGPLLHWDAETDRGEEINASTMPLAVWSEFDAKPGVPIKMKPGDILVIITDGFFEWINPDAEQFGTERIFEIVRAHRAAPAQDIIQRLHQAVVQFGRGTVQADDLTVIVVKRE
ncbi:MAG: SpoIIE family protein phosphatase [Phycisphaerae bacterium]|nr:SpoIIE family protein phosphatase [Phycisphaerae bacterium]